jgi:hypothetical protein
MYPNSKMGSEEEQQKFTEIVGILSSEEDGNEGRSQAQVRYEMMGLILSFDLGSMNPMENWTRLDNLKLELGFGIMAFHE